MIKIYKSMLVKMVRILFKLEVRLGWFVYVWPKVWHYEEV